MWGASLDWEMKFWGLVEAMEKAEWGSAVFVPPGLSRESVEAASQIVELRRQPKPRYDLQAEGIYSVEIV